MKTHTAPAITFLALLILQSGAAISNAAPVSAPALLSPVGTLVEETPDPEFVWSHSERRAHWYQIYIQKDGVFFASSWVQVEESGDQRYSIGDRLPPGEYQFWVQGWEPCYGIGPWSMLPGEFSVTCTTLTAPTPDNPPNESVFDGESGNAVSWPQFYASSEPNDNPTSTWSEIEIYRNGSLLGSQWQQNEVPGEGFDADASEIVSFDPALEDGIYTWRLRDYSPCGDVSPWSEFSIFAVENAACSDPPLPRAPSIFMDNQITNATGASNTPLVFLDFGSQCTWSEVVLVSATTGALAYSEWVHFDSADDFVLVPFLPADDYYVYTRGYNECGLGPFADVPPMITITPKTGAPIQNLEILGYSCNGFTHVRFDSQPGVDFYEFYASCEGRVLASGWTDLTYLYEFDEESAIPILVLSNENPTTKVIPYDSFSLSCASTPEIYVRAYGNGPNALGPWTQLQSAPAPPFVPTAPTSLAAAVMQPIPTLSWENNSPQGACEVLIYRDGELYASTEVYCEFVSSGPSPDYPNNEILPTQWELPFDLCPGDYTFYVRQILVSVYFSSFVDDDPDILTSAAGNWSEGHPFTVPEI